MKCKNCNENSAIIVRASDLEKEAKKSGGKLDLSKKSGIVSLNSESIMILVDTLAKAAGRLFEWLGVREKSNPRIVYCKKCHHWEKLNNE